MAEKSSSASKDYLNIDNLKGKTNGANSLLGDVYEYIGKGSSYASVFNNDLMIGKGVDIWLINRNPVKSNKGQFNEIII